MNDRLPGPLADPAPPSAAERASATPRQSGSQPGPAADGCSSRLRRSLVATDRDEPSAQLPGSIGRPRSLAELQAWLVHAITAETPLDPSGIVRPSASLTSSARLHIYRYAYRARLIECLRDDYPVLALSLGDAAFERLCHAYIEQHPSRSANLNYFGRDLPSLCAVSALEAGAFYHELAALEWALVEVTHAPLGNLALETLAGVRPESWGRACLVPSEALRVLHFSYPVNAYYQQARTTDQKPQLPEPSATATAVYRRGLGLWRMDLTPAMTRVLESLIAGATIDTALDRIGVDETDPDALAEAERSVMMWFREWVVGGFFAELVTE